jgi:hypothetical protein
MISGRGMGIRDCRNVCLALTVMLRLSYMLWTEIFSVYRNLLFLMSFVQTSVFS